MKLTLPLPPRDLSPNARVHWARKARAVSLYRTRAWAAAHTALHRRAMPQWKAAELRVTYYAPDRRRRDPDNILASLKSAVDGLRDAGVLADDDRVTWHPIVISVDRDNPRVEMVIEPCIEQEGAA